MAAYYNEIDPFAAEWLRRLILCGEIADGEVDERSIEDVRPDDLRGFTQCHFFAGIGVWSYALRLAGWPEDRPVWTGSCPCQPFSQAGRGGGFDDERHLWPGWYYLIGERRPTVIFGEQVASPAGLAWFDVVQTDLEGSGYAVGAADLCAAGVGAPHIRQRLYFVADNDSQRLEGQLLRLLTGESRQGRVEAGRSGEARELADRTEQGRESRRGQSEAGDGRDTSQLESGRFCEVGELADNARDGRREERADAGRVVAGDRQERRSAGSEPSRVPRDMGHPDDEGSQGRGERRNGAGQRIARAPSMAGFWRDAEWIPCRDGKWRPVEPGTFPLAHGAPARVGRLRAYGNAIVAPLAAEFIAAYADLLD